MLPIAREHKPRSLMLNSNNCTPKHPQKVTCQENISQLILDKTGVVLVRTVSLALIMSRHHPTSFLLDK